MPLEQYFTSDYRELIRDERDNVLDAFTQLPPHLAQTGQLVDLIGNSHPEGCQTDKVGNKKRGIGLGLMLAAFLFGLFCVFLTCWPKVWRWLRNGA